MQPDITGIYFILAGILGVVIFNLKKGFENHSCIARVEEKIDGISDIEYVKEELTTLKQYVQDMNDNG